MAIKEQNYKRAANRAADDTGKLEVLSVDLIPSEEELEMDAHTYSLDHGETPASSVADLRLDLLSRDERISTLQFDIEQLRARWTGLEKEIEAREEITQALQEELAAAKKKITARNRRISRQKRELATLASQHDAARSGRDVAEDELRVVCDKLEELTQQAEADAARIATLKTELETAQTSQTEAEAEREARLADDAAKIEALEARIEQHEAELQSRDSEHEAELQTRISEHEAESVQHQEKFNALQSRYDELDQDSTQLDGLRERLQEELATEQTTRRRLESELKAAAREYEELAAEIEKRSEEASGYAAAERAANEETIARQRGRLSDYENQLNTLQQRVAQAEAHSDELRDKLSDQQVQWSHDADRATDLAKALDETESRRAALEQQLDETLTLNYNLEVAAQCSERDSKEAIAALQGSLEAAEEDARSAHAQNEELARTLTELQAEIVSLNDSLGQIESASAERIRDMAEEADTLRSDLAVTQEKIVSKDNAISALLSELASKSRAIGSIDEIENVIQEIEGRMSERIDDRAPPDAERPTRVLTGSIEGQELRFPLFKDRLTIGRTTQNDIQIRAQYVSRRHAVILVDGESTRIVDWGSKNGIYVNSERVSEHELRSGDSVRIGAAEFVYEERARREAS